MSVEKVAVEKYGLCIEDCNFLEDKTIWVASLSNGLVVRQDDDRAGKEPVAWKRLAKYCSYESIDIDSLYLKFRSHQVHMQEGPDVQGYYFCYGAHKEFDENITRQHYGCGVLVNGFLEYEWYETPALVSTKTNNRKANSEDVQSSKLILKKAVSIESPCFLR